MSAPLIAWAVEVRTRRFGSHAVLAALQLFAREDKAREYAKNNTAMYANEETWCQVRPATVDDKEFA